MPLVSVIMPVYNAETDLCEALDSILHQTYRNLEIIVINDASTDKSAEILARYTDERLVIFHNTINLKQQKTRNIGLEFAHGKYVVNMDADDISLLNRIEIQVAYMEEHPECDVCGTAYVRFGGDFSRKIYYPESSADIAVAMITRSAMAHATVIFRKSSIKKYNIRYDAESKFNYAEDFELWGRLSLLGVTFHNINIPLYKYRDTNYGVCNTHALEQEIATGIVIQRNLNMIFDCKLVLPTLQREKYDAEDIELDFRYLKEYSCKGFVHRYFSYKDCKQIICDVAKYIALRNTCFGLIVCFKFLKYYPGKYTDLMNKWFLKLIFKCIVRYNPKNMEH